VELVARDDDRLEVVAVFAVFRFRGERATYYTGRYLLVLTIVDGHLRIRSKRVELDLTALRPTFDVAILL
jgi:p-cumate 2,3-dioxygenase subunit beta